MACVSIKNKIISRSMLVGNPPYFLFPGGNQTTTDLNTLMATLATSADVSPSAGGTLTVNSVSLGSYDYAIKNGNQTVSSFTASDWFTATEDSRSALIAVNGNLTINAGQTFIPSVRKLFTCLYVKGNLTITGDISMSNRGANHSTTGSNISAGAIRLATGTYSAVSNPQVPATGATGAAGVNNTAGGTGGTGTAGGTGGGGSGASGGSGRISGSGATGTSFSGGSGSGACDTVLTGENAYANGGAGGRGYSSAGGGAGNPGGNGGSNTSLGAGSPGTGGILIIFATGTISGAGNFSASGANGGTNSGWWGGAGSGGGSVTVFYGTDSHTGGISASGGTGASTNGGNGGSGTARKLALV
jgi:hypothetical protein